MGSAALNDDVIERVLAFGLARIPVKRAARAARTSERVTKAWRAGAIPSAWTRLIRLMREDAELCRAVMALAGHTEITLSDDQRIGFARALGLLDGKNVKREGPWAP